MKTIFIFLFTIASFCCAEKYTTYRNLLAEVSFEAVYFEKSKLHSVINSIRVMSTNSHNKPFWYEGNLPIEVRVSPSKMAQEINLKLNNVTLEEVFQALGKQADFNFKIVEDRIVIFEDQKVKKK